MAREIEVDAVENAMIETEREIALGAWDQEDTERDETGDRSHEAMGEGLEGQHEPEDDEDAEGEEADGEAESEGEAAEAEAAAVAAAAVKPAVEEQPQGRVPPGKHREALERARTAEAERDTLKAQIDKAKGDTTSLTEKLDLVMREIADLKRAPRSDAPRPAEPPKAADDPDIFEDPKGFTTSLRNGIQTEINKVLGVVRQNAVATSFELAHVKHGEAFPKAMEAVQKHFNLDNPEHRLEVQRMYNSPNPGEAVVGWYKRQQTLAEVGDDPTAYRERVAKETREALMKDPEFRKAIVAELRGEAARPGTDGQPRSTTRLPASLHRAAGSNVGAERIDPDAMDDSDQAVANAAWR